MGVEDDAAQGDLATKIGLQIGNVLLALLFLSAAYAFLRGFF